MTIGAGTKLGRYEIRSKLGAGGMGEVYLAQDTKLDRKVALKILPGDVAANRDRMNRFVREAKSAAALNHPNIAHIYEIGESGGTHFIAMEFIDGKTLRKKTHEERVPLSKLLKYLNQVAEGLAKAHAAGVVHRDLKPENIMITRDDYAKVLDFGLAKLIEPQRSFGPSDSGSSEIATALMQQRSTPGMVMGTVGYMSPEQASGRVDEIDHRSDIFSFGCILFEAATGQRPFEGKDALDSLHKIVHAPTPQLKDTNPLAPAELQRIVRRCLAKEPEKRYQSIREVAIELDDLQQELKGQTASDYSGHAKSSASVTTSGAARADEGFWVAVLPFKARDADTAVAALADGLSDEIVTGLARFRYLSVITSTSSVRLKDETEDALGAKLGARYVLEGSVRKGGSGIRVSVQLVDTQTGAQLWAETYDRDLQTSTIFALQDDVAGRIVATVADSYGVLVHSMRDAIRQKDDANLTPAEWQFQYFAYREQITPANHAALKSRLERAAKSDNRPSDLWACLAQVYLDEYAFGFPGNDETSLDRALVAARRAVELDRANQFAMVALAQTHFFRQDLAAFGPAAERAMALNPLNTDALGILGLEIVHTAEFKRGTAIVRRAMELNPNHAGWMHFAPLWDHFHKGEYAQALERANRVDVPGLFWPFLVMASACGHLGRRAEAEAAVRDLLALDPEFAVHARSNVGTWHFASGLMDPILEGLRKAGLEIPDEKEVVAPAPAAPTASLAASVASGAARAEEGFWVAVLPFKSSGTSLELKTLAEGLSEEIVTGLSRFSYLRVIAHSSTLRYASESGDVREIGKALGARYVMEGSLRQAGTKLRLAVQLIDAMTGAHLWAENYERSFSPDAVFELQDELVPPIVSTVADLHGVLPHSMSEAVRVKPPDQLSPYEAVLRSFGYTERVTADELADALACLELAVQKAPNYADALAMLASYYTQDHGQGFCLRTDPLLKGENLARKAVEIAPVNHLAWISLAQVHFFQKEFQTFTNAVERAVALNPMDGNSMATMGELLTFSGNWERGLELVERAKQLNPNHPGWYWYVNFHRSYQERDYESALGFALKVNLPSHWVSPATIAAAYGQLGLREAAAKAVRDMLKLRPEVASTVRMNLEKWWTAEDVEHFIDGLRKAGLEIPDEKEVVAPAPAALTASLAASVASGAARAEEGFWVAVLPFKSSGTSLELKTLAEGLSEEIVTGLSRFSYLRVIARSSTLRFTSESADIRAVGKELGARYVMEGSLRLASSTLRVAVQLVDATSGAHLWAETYDRAFSSDQIFAIQDDLVPRIVSTVADHYGVVPHSICEALRSRKTDELSPYEVLMRFFDYTARFSPESHAETRANLEQVVQKVSTPADCWAMLSDMYADEYKFGFNPQPDPLGRALAAARRAVDLAPSNSFAHFALAQVLFFRKEFDAFRAAAERALKLNPMDGGITGWCGNMMAFAGDWEHGCKLVERATQLNPHHPGWYWCALFYREYLKGDYREALNIALKINMPGFVPAQIILAAVYGQLGERSAADKARQDLVALVPVIGQVVREELLKWYLPDLVEHLIDGLRKAGLEIADKGQERSDFSLQDVRSATDDKLKLELSTPSIAVLPFVNISNDPDNEYFCDGLAEEILNALAKIENLKVGARTSAFSFKDKNVNISEIGRVLGVNTVLEGSVRKADDRVRITVQLVNVADGYHLWSERYDREMKDIFDVQDEITLAVVDALKVKLLGEEQGAVLKRHTRNPEAHEFYLRGLFYFNRFTPDDFQKASESFRRAIAIDPRYASAYAGLADAYTELSFFAFSPSETMPKAREAANKALELDDRLGEAHNSLAIIKMYFDWDYAGAEAAFKRAIALNPGSAPIHMWYGWYLGLMGRFDESFKEMQGAQELDPLSATNNSGIGIVFHWSRQPERAIEQFRKVLELNPNYPIARSFLAEAYEQQGDFVSAIATIEKIPQATTDPLTLSTMGYVYAKSGNRHKALEILNEFVKRSNQEYVPALNFAQIYAGLGDYEQALGWLDKACNERAVWIPFLKVDLKFEPLRSDPRFQELLKKVGFPAV